MTMPTAVVSPPQSPSFSILPVVLSLFFVVLVYKLIWRRHHLTLTPPGKLRLPPGSMGWPYIGETLKLFTENPNSFFSNREKRYGKIFKTHILGCPCVMVSSPKLAKMVLVSESHMFKPTYPVSKERMIGPEAVFFHQGPYHTHLKKLIQSSFLPSAIKGSVPDIEDIVLGFLPTWEHNHTINTLTEMKKYAFEVAMLSVFGKNLESKIEGIKSLYRCLEKGYNSMPLDLPATPFNKAMKARKALHEKLRRVIEKRKESRENGEGLLGTFMLSNEVQGKMKLSESQIADNIIGVIFAAHDTTATALTWLIKYLHDNPKLLQAVKREQEEIRCKRIEAKRGITWDDTRLMPLTTRVIQETLRVASILSFTYREAVEDVEMEGYLIPKGWKVLPLFRSIHYSSNFFPHPNKFDPSRFEVAPQPNTYMPFGNGAHSCPGSELAKLEMLIFVHHLTTTFRWEVIGDDGIQYGPFPVPQDGLPIKVCTLNED
ncbi:abscisic acid 8'-hydroxylase 2-like [Bidens hawaiensis]|uniref:abscisic acid 8'-hydroxylase 2-like n=1 Tax=Bidens hawaiensis TaxID=980011 RepID=UPI004049FE66